MTVQPIANAANPIGRKRFRALAGQNDNAVAMTDLVVPQMHCAGCMRKIETGLADLPGVQSARANLSSRRVRVSRAPSETGDADLVAALADLGFDAALDDEAQSAGPEVATGRTLLISLAVAGFAAANIMLLSVSVWSGAEGETARLFQLISGLIALPAVAFAGQPFFRSAAAALRACRLNMDVPISLAVLLALAMSIFESIAGDRETYFDAAVTLLFFLLVGRYLDFMMRDKARSAMTWLARLLPDRVEVIDRDGTTRPKAVADVRPGDYIRIKAGERCPLDANVMSGTSDLDRSIVTGESQAVATMAGMRVEAGVLNLTGPLILKVQHSAEQSFVAEVRAMMEAAGAARSGYVRIADRAAQIYAPAVHLVALLSFIGWLVATGGDWQQSLYVAISVLIITCPCALGLAVPIAQVVACGRLLRTGVMVRDGAALEKLADADMVLFDKTGTLTTGEPALTDVAGGSTADRALAKALARQSDHPLAKAITTLEAGAVVPLISNVAEHPGLGLSGDCDGEHLRLGKAAWVREIAGMRAADESQSNDGSEVHFSREGGATVRFTLTDRLRDDAAGTIDRLKSLGLGLEIASGDKRQPVLSAAAALGVEAAGFNLSPADKIARIKALEADGRKVVYVGDGLNDAAALASAHVSMAPASGCDVGRAAADIVFTSRGIGPVADAVQLARRTASVIRQNFGLAVAYNLVAVPVAVLGHASPLVAALAMSTSSIAVIANSLRLNIARRDPSEYRSPQAQQTFDPSAGATA